MCSRSWTRSPTATSSRSSTQDETQCYATILAIPNYRLKATGKTVVTFRERPAGQPEALRAWFYPGRNWGEEFVYPKAKAVELAKTTNTPVLFMAVEMPVEVEAPIKTADEPVVVQLKQAPIMAIKPTGEEVELAAGGHPATSAGTGSGDTTETGSRDATEDGELVAADRAVRVAGFGRGLDPPAGAKARSVRGLVHHAARLYFRRARGRCASCKVEGEQL